MVTVTPHLLNAIGVMAISEDAEKGVFTQLVAKDTAVPCRRARTIPAPKHGGSVLVKICEAVRNIKVTRPEPKPKANGAPKEMKDEDDSDFDSEEDEPEEVREKVWKVDKTLAEAALKDVKKGAQVEVTINVSKDMTVQVTAREVGGKGGVRGTSETGKPVENGNA